jgi:menaquinone-dependent protoporphyrinogen oxidase
MKDEKAVSRRKFLKIAGGMLGGGVLLCGGGAYLGLQVPDTVEYPESTCGMALSRRVLVAYASKCGATGEISRFIAEKLCEGGFSVDLERAGNVRSVSQYSSVVLGTAVYMGKPLNEALDFAREVLAEAKDKRIALFDVCLTMKENTPDNLQTALGYLDGFSAFFAPVLKGALAGRISHETLPPLYRTFARADQEGILAQGDFRDWNQIENWVHALNSVVTGKKEQAAVFPAVIPDHFRA